MDRRVNIAWHAVSKHTNTIAANCLGLRKDQLLKRAQL